MSAPLPLAVPAPAIDFIPIRGTHAPLEDAVNVTFSSVRFPDGSAMLADDFVAAQALLSRTLTSGSAPELWDASLNAWRAGTSVDFGTLSGVALVPPKVAIEPWRGVFVGVGQKDATGAAWIHESALNYPQYRLRGAFRAKRAGIEAFGIGPESAPIEFASLLAARRFTVDLSPDNQLATRVQIALRSVGKHLLGVVDIDASGGNTVVKIANFDGGGAALASITLHANGSIQLAPAASGKVIVAGILEAKQIRYGSPGSLKDLI